MKMCSCIMKTKFQSENRLKLISLIIVAFLFTQNLIIGQVETQNNFSCEVNKIYPPVSITKEKLKDVESLSDINGYYESSWVRDYVSVEVSGFRNGKIEQVLGNNDILNDEQLNLIKSIDTGSKVSVIVKYMPKNNLKINEMKEMNFTFSIDPDNEAVYSNGNKGLNEYLRKNVLEKVSIDAFKQYQLAAYKFIISKDGEVVSPSVFWSSENEDLDQLVLDAICNMPKWKPARYADGTEISQEYVLTVGDMESCVVNMLHIHQE